MQGLIIGALSGLSQAAIFQILVVFALISPVKVQNMILGGGTIRSGGMKRDFK